MPKLVHSSKLTVHRIKRSISRKLPSANHKSAFTMIELMVVITILSILTGIGTYSYNNAQMKGRDTKRKQDAAQIKAALQLYWEENKAFPPSAANPSLCPNPSSGPAYSICASNNSGGDNWIPELAPYLQKVPKDLRQGLLIDSVKSMASNIKQQIKSATSKLASVQTINGKKIYSQTRSMGQVAGAGTQGPLDPTTTSTAVGAYCANPCNYGWTSSSNAVSINSAFAFVTLPNNPPTAGSYVLLATGFAFAIPANATVTGLQMNVIGLSNGATMITDKDNVILKSGNTLSANRANLNHYWPTANQYFPVYGSAADLWGLTWTPAEVNNNFWVGVGCKNVYSLASPTCYIDDIQMTVFYSTPDPTVTTGSATSITGTAATLNGSVNPNGASTNAWFRWGTTNPGCASLPNATGAVNVGAGASPIGTGSTIAYSGSPIYFCLVAQSNGPVIYGTVNSFSSQPDLYLTNTSIHSSANCSDGFWPPSIASGSTVYVCAFMRNDGNITTGTFRTSVYRNQAGQPATPSSGDGGGNFGPYAPGQPGTNVLLGSFAASNTGCTFAATNTYSCYAAAFADAYNTESESNESNNFNTTQYYVTTGLPDAPTGLTPGTATPYQQITTGFHGINWNPSTGATSYLVRLNDESDGVWPAVACDQVPYTTTTPQTGDICSWTAYSTFNTLTYNFQANKTWSWWVHACNSNGCGNATGLYMSTKPAYGVTWGAENPPTTIASGSTITTPISITNAGFNSWPNSGGAPVNFAYHWYPNGCGGSWITYNGQRTGLPTTVAPNSTVSSLNVTINATQESGAALTPGTYCLEYDLVHETDCWFSGIGANCTGALTKNSTVTIGAANPTVSLSAAPPGPFPLTGNSTLSWTVTNSPTSCDRTSNPANAQWNANGISGTSSNLTVNNITTTTIFTIVCHKTGFADSAPATVTITIDTAAPIINSFTVNGTATATITSGQSATLNWQSTNTTSCTASNGWTGAVAVTGTQSVSPSSNAIYTLTCSKAGFPDASQSVSVTVNQPSIASNSCSSQIGIYCYVAGVRDGTGKITSYTVWMQLENKNDPEVNTNPNAKCKDISPDSSLFNYCVKSE
ncbi:prepilin-type N-terminal cleavage/methylation domain-containing protein [Candidatus Curtissbacteria bacterium]|nr:prepilin-type N-terminal cleavage/methylation domain-containing protein [Candidatus Curtissbacteria bacterium]